jgi:hypothetical protein
MCPSPSVVCREVIEDAVQHFIPIRIPLRNLKRDQETKFVQPMTGNQGQEDDNNALESFQKSAAKNTSSQELSLARKIRESLIHQEVNTTTPA